MTALAKELWDLLWDVISGKMKVDEARKKALEVRKKAYETESDETLEWMDERIAELEAELPASER